MTRSQEIDTAALEAAADAAADAIRAQGFDALADDMAELPLLANAVSYVTEKLLVDDTRCEMVSMRIETARMLDFMVHQLVRRADEIEAKWADAHNRACAAERVVEAAR